MPSLSALRTQLSTRIAQRVKAAAPVVPLPARPREFLKDCTFTNDEHWKAKGLTSAIQPFPDKQYIDFLTDEWEREQRLWIDKSRDLIVTWWTTAVHLHAALTIPGIYIGYQSKTFDDANAFLEARFMTIYDNIPASYTKPLAVHNVGKGVIVIHHENGPKTRIMAIAEGGDKVRQYKFAYYIWDEAAFQRWQKKTFTALRPTLDAGGKLVVISSANGKNNLQYQIGHEDIAPG